MALSKAKVREILSKAGVDSEHMQEALTEILDGNLASVDAVKEERDRYKEQAEKYQAAQKELDELKKAGDKDPYRVKYEALKEDFEDYKKGIEQKETKAKKVTAYKALLTEAGIPEKRISAILKVSDIDAMKLEKDGTLHDAEKLSEAIKEEWADFIPTQSEKGAEVANPPANNTGKGRMTREEIMKISDTTERQKAWAEFLEDERKM